MCEKENQRIMLTKRLLKESLVRLMKTKDVQTISVKELCEDSGISRSTFYNHYGCPVDVLEEIENEMIAKIPVASHKFINGKDINRKTFIQHTTNIFQYVQDNHDFALMLLSNKYIDSAFSIKVLDFLAIRNKTENFIPDNYDDMDRIFILNFIHGGFYNIIRKWVVDDGHKTAQDMAELMADMVDRVFSWENFSPSQN